jgi:nucleotide-binding universal stress UspA family protein
MKKILVPVDLSRATGQVCTAAMGLARSLKGRIILLHAVPPPPVTLAAYGFAQAEVSRMLASLEIRATRRLLALGRRCEKSRRPVRVIQRIGRPVPTILAKVAALKPDLIVIGSHGHNAAYDLLVGSTTSGVIRNSRCPVLVVPIPRD